MKDTSLCAFEQRSQDEQVALLALTLVDGVGAGLAARLLEHFGAALSIVAATEAELRAVEGVGEAVARSLGRGAPIDRAAQLWHRIQNEEIGVHLRGTLSYPRGLLRLSSPPLLVFTQGAWPEVWEHERAVAVVGTRRPDPRGVRLTQTTTELLVREGWWIVSGGALGIDTAAHRAALHGEGRTLAVMATGVDCPYPHQNRRLFQQMCERGGVLLSEFPPGTRPEKGHFPRRNRLISALSGGVVVVQCGAKSGALHSAHCARRIRVPVMTFPGRPQEELAAGPHALLRRGAWLVESAHDVMDVLEGATPGSRATQLSLWSNDANASGGLEASASAGLEEPLERVWEELPPLGRAILGALPVAREQAVHLDALACRLERAVAEVASALVMLELEGWIWSTAAMEYGRYPRPGEKERQETKTEGDQNKRRGEGWEQVDREGQENKDILDKWGLFS